MTPDFLQILLPSMLGALGGALISYITIRVDIAVLKARSDFHDAGIRDAHELADEAHTRIDRLRRHEMDTR